MTKANRASNLVILTFIILIGILLRLYQFNAPIADTHSREQAETLQVSKMVIESGSVIGRYEQTSLEKALKPTFPVLYNPTRLLVYETKIAYISQLFPQLSLVQIARMINIMTASICIASIYFLALRFDNRRVAIIASLFFAISPFTVLHTHLATPMTTTLAIMLLSIVFLYLSMISRKKKLQHIIYYALSLIFCAIGIAVEPLFVVFLVPLFYLLYHSYGLEVFRSVYLYVFVFFACLITFSLNAYSSTLPQLLPFPIWASKIAPDELNTTIIYLQNNFVTTLLKHRLLDLILGGFGISFVYLGIIKKRKQYNIVHWFAIAFILSIVLLPHDHLALSSLQLIAIPALAFYFASGIDLAFFSKKLLNTNLISLVMVLFSICAMMFFSWNEIKKDYKINTNIVQIAKIISTITSENDLVATDTKGDPTLLYLSDRRGVATTDNGDTELRNSGIKYLYTQNKGYASTLEQVYQMIFSSENGFIFDLSNKL